MLERENPLSLAKEFNKYCEIAVIDLDAVLGRGKNFETIKELLKVSECRVGGGIRTLEKAKELISLGAKKVIIGTKAFEDDRINHNFLQELVSHLGRYRVIIALDALNGEIVSQGWTHKTGLDLFDVINEIEKYAGEFLFTCIEREGTLKGTDMALVRKLVKLTENKITVAGGVSTLEEIRELTKIGADVQLGMSLYTGKVHLGDAFIESLNWKDGLTPTITQNTNGQVLLLAYSSKESLRKTFEEEKMWYFSRSRNALWQKGETSGNIQEFVKIRAGCDRDALLATVKQKGNACHTGAYSCFGDKKFTFYELYETLKDRIENPSPESYTAKLTDGKLRDKLLEEANEIVAARGSDEVTWEVADMLYFLTVLLAKKGIEIDDVLFEFARRRK